MISIIDVNEENMDQTGFFCMRSKPKSTGYKRKLNWLKDRLAEGMQIKLLLEDGYPRGFIEFVPSESAWRAVHADDFLMIHCLWIVGQGKGKGYGAQLLEACIREGEAQNKSGIAMVTSQKTWVADSRLFLKYGFSIVDEAPPNFQLVVKKLKECQTPSFPTDWEARAEKYGEGITILRSDQCPYIDQSVEVITDTAGELGIPTKVIEIHTCQEAQSSPSAYGVFTVLYNGRLLTYHPVTKRDLLKLLGRE